MLPDDLAKKSSVAACPVPPEQMPLNEYRELNESWFFRWATLDLFPYLRKLGWVWLWSWAIAGPVAAASFPLTKDPLHFLLMGAGGASLFLSLVLLRLYLGWAYISSRLSDATVFYEESGWYDGQTWSKPLEVLTQDRLVVTYQVQPLLKRLKKTLAILALILLSGGLVWVWL
ncbi:MAG: CGLD27 family protein [Leptolyngbyaceae cyanobacterium HOT.MB2.61]|nr:CGLD27 family protein [Leptolyngbyaceae cyanobacterium HOT.MB2.61]